MKQHHLCYVYTDFKKAFKRVSRPLCLQLWESNANWCDIFSVQFVSVEAPVTVSELLLESDRANLSHYSKYLLETDKVSVICADNRCNTVSYCTTVFLESYKRKPGKWAMDDVMQNK